MVCCSRAARGLPKPFHRLTRPSSAASALPPAFLAPRIHAQSFLTQPPQLASASPSKDSTLNSAQNLRATLRRLGQSSEWAPQAPIKTEDSRKATKKDGVSRNGSARDSARRTSHSPSFRSSASGAKSELSAQEQKHQIGFRLKAKELLDHINGASRDLEARTKSSRIPPAQIDAEINEILDHFDGEMRSLRVMIKTKDVLEDPDNAWKSASRIKAPCNAALRLCLHQGRVERATKLFNSMKKDGIFPSAATYTVMINGFSRALTEQGSRPRSNSNPEAMLQSKQAQQIRDLYQEIEKLWKQAFPQYFQRSVAGPRSQSDDIMALDRENFHKLTEQACRNLISQQASINEIRDHPKMFTHTLGAYLNFLRLVDLRDELRHLFDRLFPSDLIEIMAKGLAQNASPQDKLELANRKLSESLPLGDVSTFSAMFVESPVSPASERLATVERIWPRLATLMDLELHEKQAAPQAKPSQRQKDDHRTARKHAEADRHRFLPDDRLMADIFAHLQAPPDDATTHGFRLGLLIFSKVYGLDLDSTADGIIRAPQPDENDRTGGLQRYFTATANGIDGNAQPMAELRDPIVATCLFRMLHKRELRKQRIALFNYLWARGFADQQAANSQEDAVESTISDPTTFGRTLRPTLALGILWDLCEAGDPVGARFVLEAMKRTAQGASIGPVSTRDVISRRVQRSRHFAIRADQNDAQNWKPSDLSYIRVLRANLIALLHTEGPGGLTATMLEESSSPASGLPGKQPKYDAWTESKSLFAEWCDQKKLDSDFRQPSSRWTSSENDQGRHTLRTVKKSDADRGGLPDGLKSRIHTDNMRSVFLHIAKFCASQQGGEGAQVAREALHLVNDKVGLEALVKETQMLRDDIAIASRRITTSLHKVRTLDYLSKVMDLALDTSNHSFAPKADVELWKCVRNMLSASHVSADKEENKSGSNRSRDAWKQLVGGSNRLLLSKDDYLELEAEADKEEDVFEQGEEEQVLRGSYRMQRRSRHVEQELERWVRGSSS